MVLRETLTLVPNMNSYNMPDLQFVQNEETYINKL